MKKLFLLAGLLLFLTFGQRVYAHELKEDGTIQALLHIDPGDEPVAGEQTTFHVEITDTTKKFSTANCDCILQITQGKKTLYDKPMFPKTHGGQPPMMMATYTFAKKGDYTLTVSGKPKTDGDFQTFSLSYPVSVDQEKPAVSPTPTAKKSEESFSSLNYIVFGGILLVLLVALIFTKK